MLQSVGYNPPPNFAFAGSCTLSEYFPSSSHFSQNVGPSNYRPLVSFSVRCTFAMFPLLPCIFSVNTGFTARRYASAVYAVVVHLSVGPPVCLFVTSRHCTKTAKRRITKTTIAQGV